MKRCARCGEVKPLEEFNRSTRNRDGRHGYCRECQKAHYRENAVRHRANVRRTSAMRLAEIRAVIVAAMAQGCVDCGFSDIRALDFDHVRGQKVDSVSAMIRQGRGNSVVVDEIAKCEVRCKNCHAIATVERLGGTWHDRFLLDADGAPGRN